MRERTYVVLFQGQKTFVEADTISSLINLQSGIPVQVFTFKNKDSLTGEFHVPSSEPFSYSKLTMYEATQ